jgi:hypothetical protein
MKTLILILSLAFALNAQTVKSASQISQAEIVSTDPATCTPSDGRLIFNTVALIHKYCSAANTWSPMGGAGTGVGGAANLTTVGAIPYVSASGVLNQDQTAGSQLSWDPATHRLGLGTTTPGQRFVISGNGVASYYFMQVLDTGAPAKDFKAGVLNSAGAYFPGLWFGQSAPNDTNYAMLGDTYSNISAFNGPRAVRLVQGSTTSLSW